MISIWESRMLICSLTKPMLRDRSDETDSGHVARPVVSASMSPGLGLRAFVNYRMEASVFVDRMINWYLVRRGLFRTILSNETVVLFIV
jgi:hypothetical protein